MNIQNEKRSEQIQIVSIEICKEDYAANVEAALKKQRRTAQVPGFRPGNAPMPMIRRMYEKSFIADEINRMMYDELNKFVHDNKIELLGEPMPVDDKTVVDFDHPEKFVFTFEVASQKPFEIDYAQLPEITKYEITASESEIDAYVMDLRKRHGQYSSPEVISEEDFVTVEYGENNNGNFYGNDLNEAGKKLFIGKKLKDVVTADVNTIFADESKLNAFLKAPKDLDETGEPHNFEMTIKYIGHLEPAALDEDFFKKAFPDGKITNEKDLRKEAASKIEAEYTQHSQRKFMNDAIGVLVDHVNVELPEDFLKRYILYAQKDMTAEKLEAEYDNYAKSFKWQLLENKITKDNNIQVTEEDIKAYVHQFFLTNYFANFNADDVKDRVESLVADTLKNKETVKNIYDQLFDDQIGKALAAKMKASVKKVTFEEFASELYGIKEDGVKAEKKSRAKKAAKKDAPAEEEPAAEAKPKKKAAPKTKKTTPKAE